MIQFKKILLVNRGENRRDSGLDHAANLARMTGASLTVVGAMRTGPALPGLGRRAKALNKIAEKNFLDGLAQLVKRVRQQGISVTTTVSSALQRHWRGSTKAICTSFMHGTSTAKRF